jgi:hypothetical protein
MRRWTRANVDILFGREMDQSYNPIEPFFDERLANVQYSFPKLGFGGQSTSLFLKYNSVTDLEPLHLALAKCEEA